MRHTAENVAAFIMKEVVLVFGALRELLTEGALELTGASGRALVSMLQAQQISIFPHRLQMIGLVERFHRTWNIACRLTCMTKNRMIGKRGVAFAVYAYNYSIHSKVALSPNELVMERNCGLQTSCCDRRVFPRLAS